MGFRSLLASLLVAFCLSSAQAQVSQKCLADISQNFGALTSRLATEYEDRGGELSPEVQPRVLLSANAQRAILLVHGFLGSPQEVSYLGDVLHHTGYTVAMPLLPGFGSTSKIANKGTVNGWQASAKFSLMALAKCYQEITVIGFSMGASLMTDLLLNSNIIDENGHIAGTQSRIMSAVLVAPYYAPASGWLDLLKWKPDFIGGGISVPLLATVTGHPDLKVLVANKKPYQQKIPLEAARKVLSYGADVKEASGDKLTKVPTFLIMSEGDRTVNAEVAIEFVDDHFVNAYAEIYPESLGLSHHILLPAGNPYLKDTLATIAGFVLKQ